MPYFTILLINVNCVYILIILANFCPHKDNDQCPENCFNYRNDLYHSQIDPGIENSEEICLLTCPNCGGGWPPCDLNFLTSLGLDSCNEPNDDAVCFHKV